MTKRTDLDLNQLREWRAEGLSIEKIANKLNCSYNKVYKTLKKHSFDTKTPYKNKQALLPEIHRLYESGMSKSDIVRELECSFPVVTDALRNTPPIDLHATSVLDMELNFKVVRTDNPRFRIYECGECGHSFERATNNFLQNPNCPKCAPRSRKEDEFIMAIEAVLGPGQRNVKLRSGLELDWVKDGIALEFNGNYWHSNLFRDKNYHKRKYQDAHGDGYRLIQIFEFEWDERREVVLSLIKSKFGIFQKRIYARKTEVCELDSKESREFFEQNHLQGHANAITTLGLKFKGELVAALSLRKFGKTEDYEICRFAQKKDYQVIGGFSKLLSRIKLLEINTLFSYSDYRISTGNVYEKCGFKFVKNTQPDFFWLKNGRVLPRQASWGKIEEFRDVPKLYGTGHALWVLGEGDEQK